MTGRVEHIGDATVSDLAAGVAGEHLVCADLLLRGMNAFRADQNCPYDVAVERGGNLIRVQVKTTRTVKPVPQRVKHTPAYLFHTRRCGKGGRRAYNETDFDILALVALDIRAIAYLRLSETRQTIHLSRTKFFSLSSFDRGIIYLTPDSFSGSHLLTGPVRPHRVRRKPMFQIIAFNTIQATAQTEAEAEVKRAKFQQAINDSYRGGEPCRVTVQRKEA